MCNPALAIAGAGLALGVYGAAKSAGAAKDAARATATQNLSDTNAQNEGFASRLTAANVQTEGQKSAFQAQMENEQNAADAMRTGQNTALTGQQDTLAALNAGESGLHDVGTQAANLLLDQTSGGNLAQSQADWKARAASLLDASGMPLLTDSAPTTGGTGDDPYVNAALARRAAEAATNIRSYGSKVGQVGSYEAPLRTVQDAVTNTATGIMPAQMASRLLQGSTPVLMQPSQTAWGNAQNFGQASIAAAQQAGQANQNIAGLQYQNSTDIANLTQSDKVTTASNIAEQARADAAYKAAIGGVISQVGNLGTYAAGYYGDLPGFLKTGANASAAKLANGSPPIISI